LEQRTSLQDQAESLREKISVSSLPSRSEYHKNKRKKSKIKIRYPMVSFLAFIFVLIPVAFVSITFYLDYEQNAGTKSIFNHQTGFEAVSISTEDYETGNTESGDADQENEKIIIHKVKVNETLSSISMKYYHSKEGEKLIRDWNHLNNSNIYEGQILEIPLHLSVNRK
jgi:LysM repeat protein